MEPGGSIPHLQGFSNNPYPEPNQPNSRTDTHLVKVHSSIVLPATALPKCIFPVDFPVKILKALIPSSILATCPARGIYLTAEENLS